MVSNLKLNNAINGIVTGLSSSRARRAIAGMLVLGSVYVAATSTWMLLPLEVPLPNSMPVEKANGSQSSSLNTIDIAALQGARWFGAGAGAATTPDDLSPRLSAAESEAVASNLRLELIGVVLAEDTRFSRAILNLQGKQESFAIGDILPAGRAVKLVKVLSDRIIIDNGGRYEYINLYENSDKLLATAIQPAATYSASTVEPQADDEDDFVDLSSDEQVTQLVSELREKVMKDPNTLYQIVNVSPLMEDGELKGYKLSQGSMRAEFEQLGFKNGDVLTAVNGIQLNSPQALGDVMTSLQNGGIADLELLRGGNIFNISVSLDASQ